MHIFDTTLRDGEQSPGCSMSKSEKVSLAKQLEILGVDIIEAGFAAASKGDFESVKAIAETVQNSTIASLSRAVEKDIDLAYEAIKNAVSPRIHTFIATSDIHMTHKLKMSKDAVVERAVYMTRYAKKYCQDIEFSAEDATRSDPRFLGYIFDEVIKAGATVINIPDTVGYTTPDEFFRFINEIKSHSEHLNRVSISVHCHNDLGMAVANSLAAVRAGINQIECTVNGIGERAGNAALEEIAMTLAVRKDIYNVTTRINTHEIMKTSKMLSSITGVHVQPNKAIVGANAFAHESGIHQHGVLAERSTYEIMSPESVGLLKNHMVLGKHSGKHGFNDRLNELGYKLDPETTDSLFEAFKDLADKKKVVYDDDIEALIMTKVLPTGSGGYILKEFVINIGNTINNMATVTLENEKGSFSSVSLGDGPVDAAYKAINTIVGIQDITLEDYQIKSVTEGNDAMGEAAVMLKVDGKPYRGVAVSTDIIEASIKAYLSALNKISRSEDQI